MGTDSTQDVTVMLSAVARGDPRAAGELLPLVYNELRALAGARMAKTPPGHTLPPTALGHEAYLRLVGEADPGWQNRGHVFAAAATAMRQIIVDHARRKGALKRGGDRARIAADADDLVLQSPPEEILALD